MLEQYVFVLLKKCGVDDAVLDMFSSPDFPSSQTKLHDGFILPIDYLEPSQIHQLQDSVIADLELDTNTPERSSMYDMYTQPQHSFAKQMIAEFKHKYTTNVEYLRDTQKTIMNMAHYENEKGEKTDEDAVFEQKDCDDFVEMWKELKEDAAFLEKYSFMEWKVVEHLNRSSTFLQTWSTINIMSPLTSLLVPIIFLLFPFILIRMKGVPITFEQYIDTLREIAKHHFIGKVLNIKSLSFESIMYLVFTGGLYLLQMYQNTMSCIRFYTNLQRMNAHLLFLRKHTNKSIRQLSFFVKHNGNLPTYARFISHTEHQLDTLKRISGVLEPVRPFTLGIYTCMNVGYMLKIFYQIHSEREYEQALRYSVGFAGYFANLAGIYDNVKGGFVQSAIFSAKKHTKLTQQYYPVHKHLKPVKNNCKLKKNIIISGINASGKTTYLKSTAINIIFTQQFGMGFYRKCVLHPYTHIHSYLNIPDTSCRDSLFQAESRRCKEIIDAVQETQNTHSRHFCIFDELYSGTNPEEATKSAYSLLNYLAKFNNVHFILTTHYVALCKKYKGHSNIANYKMNVVRNTNGSFQYTYKIKKGISHLHGGIEILKTMNYPQEIIRNIENIQM